MVSDMGIRYYAYPVRASDVQLARSNPRDFLSDDPLADAWGPVESKPRMLYLDKAWRQLQEFFTQELPAALPLVDGDVTHVQCGWIPHIRVLAPDQVGDVAHALAAVGEVDVLAARLRTFGGDSVVNDDAYELRYVMEHLDAAKSFTTSLARDGLGLIYMIG